MPSALDAAPRFPIRLYLRDGAWHKQPRFKGWQQHATADPAKLSWWRERYGNNFGIHLGTALVAIDADRHGVDGVAALAALTDGGSGADHRERVASANYVA
jgi:Bifunctional DNA primase/polymerase, N-terminal